MAEEGHRVTLNVYDLSQGLARQLSTSFLGKTIEGIWHTGIVVYGNEYYFGGGIQHAPAGSTQYGTPIRVVELGVTHVPKDVFEMYLQEIGSRYMAETYSLLTHNCNNFSNEVAQFLVGATIPEYILQLPNEVMSSPMGALILPMIQNLETTMKSGAVPQVPQFRPSGSTTYSAKKTSSSPSPATDQRTAKDNEVKGKSAESETTNNAVPPAAKPVDAVAGDPLGDARNKVQEEIGAEFAALMASGTLRASEAAALATRRVMQRYGHIGTPQS
ncbi:desumoylating isopeptidase 1-like [Quillaja saponaria]|uniref:Desumoylating isopeptidase 1-like n=1 Tax=Quillaja saponaria TaxID=32244 RepID=A0AAD7L3X6_QUISA|nr:desumoylating isopeptidase 1-like [Quillaja saponaria]